MREGAEANAVVLSSTYWQSSGGVDLTLRVHFDDGSKVEIARNEGVQNVGIPTEGDILPMRFDRADRSHVEIDLPTLRGQLAQQQEQRRQEAIARGEAELTGNVRGEEASSERGGHAVRASDTLAEIVELKQAHAAGTITEDEFQIRRAEMLSRLEQK
jgi:hypothetical protein